jgi:hypothetical protein
MTSKNNCRKQRQQQKANAKAKADATAKAKQKRRFFAALRMTDSFSGGG